ncbi:hypothetical protein HAX54_044150, partial [Datura stramonium]|nr:hypothetical protein [Datura stramonium]
FHRNPLKRKWESFMSIIPFPNQIFGCELYSARSQKTEAGIQNDNNLVEMLRMITVRLDALDATTFVERRSTNQMNVQLDEDEEDQGNHGSKKFALKNHHWMNLIVRYDGSMVVAKTPCQKKT